MGVKIDNIDESNYDDVLKVTISKNQKNLLRQLLNHLLMHGFIETMVMCFHMQSPTKTMS